MRQGCVAGGAFGSAPGFRRARGRSCGLVVATNETVLRLKTRCFTCRRDGGLCTNANNNSYLLGVWLHAAPHPARAQGIRSPGASPRPRGDLTITAKNQHTR